MGASKSAANLMKAASSQVRDFVYKTAENHNKGSFVSKRGVKRRLEELGVDGAQNLDRLYAYTSAPANTVVDPQMKSVACEYDPTKKSIVSFFVSFFWFL